MAVILSVPIGLSGQETLRQRTGRVNRKGLSFFAGSRLSSSLVLRDSSRKPNTLNQRPFSSAVQQTRTESVRFWKVAGVVTGQTE